MKKTFCMLTLSLGLASSCQAATVLGLEVGATAWHSDSTIEQNGGAKTRTDSDVALAIYGAFEHPIPFVPNVRAEIMQNENDVRRSSGSSKTAHTDITAYYEILDNWITLDLGLSARAFDAKLDDAGTRHKADSTLGALYAKLQFDLPLTGLSIGAIAQHDGGLNGGQSLEDYSLYAQYKLGFGLGLRGGYRLQDYTLKYKDLAPSKRDHSIDGVYISAFWQF